ncbi:MAG: hypothetical protein KIG31_06835 [Oscillospiraceae bacterium]|nr:hypothetical protein [Oscillospiraceae bacterium]MCI6972394.1 hypothetical protein [Clostridiales bacterium]
MGIVIAILLAVWVFLAVRSLRRDGSCSCGGSDCSHCGNKGKCGDCSDKCNKR